MVGKEEGDKQDHKRGILLGVGREYNSVDEYQEFSKAHEAKEMGNNLPCCNIEELDQSKRKDHVSLTATDYLVISRDTGEMVWKGTESV